MPRMLAPRLGRTAVVIAILRLVAACRGDTPLSAQHAGADTTGLVARVRPLVQRADSLERRAEWAEAAATWQQAAEAAPPLQHWFVLRAASAMRDERARNAALGAFELPATADSAAWPRRIAGAHLRALLRFGDTTAAIARYLQLGNTRDSVVALSLRQRRGDPLNDTERLALARGARAIGDAPMARRELLELVRDASPVIEAEDRYGLGQLLFATGEYASALRAYDEVGGAYAGRAAYQRARTLLRMGRATDAVRALRLVTTRHADDGEAAGLAWYLLGDLAADAGRDDDAAASWEVVATKYPAHALAPRSAFRAAMMHVAAGEWQPAQRLLSALAAAPSDEQNAARYWLARTLATLGERERAAELWRLLIHDVPDSYYALLAARRLDTVPVVPATNERRPASASGPVRVGEAAIAAAAQRMQWLEELGLGEYARDERSDLLATASHAESDARTAAQALLNVGMPSAAMQLVARVPTIVRSTNAGDQRLRYPMPYDSLLVQHAAAHGLSASFMAALIRQESRFTATARSGASAMGLMQVMPAVGRSIAGTLGIRPWHDTLLYDPSINVRIGSRHLAASLRREGAAHPAYALAAYNAGRSRVLRWRAKRGAASDWELFVERIPYVETRDYVRIVLRNAEWYRVLY